jgi:glycerophosphoryl diester phosphodiesterase
MAQSWWSTTSSSSVPPTAAAWCPTTAWPSFGGSTPGPGSIRASPANGEALEWAAGRTRLAIEIKNGPLFYEGIEAKIVELLERHRMRDRALVISFDHHALRRLRDLDTTIATGVLYFGRPLDPLPLARAAGSQVLEPHWSFVTAEDVAAAHAAGLRLSTWATSDPAVLRQLVEAGVDGIATDHPDVLVRMLAEQP